jgi:ABC-2 type transport system permease protein
MKICTLQFMDIFCKLVATHVLAIRKQFCDMVINLYVWVFCSLVIMAYLMQSFGLAANYGCFQFASIIGTVGLFEVYGNVTKNVMDFEGDRNISYYLTLPTKPWVILASLVTFYALVSIVLSCLVLPFGKLILYNTFNIAAISWLKLVVIVILSNVFFGVFTLAITTHVGTMAKMRNIWSRFIFPTWILGCFQFSWAVMYAVSAPLAYVMFCNPVVFIMEGTRAALLGQADFLPWSMCCGALSMYIVVGWLYMNYKMKRLLDFV